jgi:hypothetical protein
MIARSMQPDPKQFSKGQSDNLPFLFCRGADNRPPKNPVKQLETQIEQLKMQYKFIHPDEIAIFLKRHPFLIADLHTIHEIKSQYFGEAPMTLYYIDETGWLEDASLAAYIQTDMPREKAQEIFSQFDEEWWENISKEAKCLITVDKEAVAAKEL